MSESLPWASGKRKPHPGGKPTRRRRFRLKSRKQGVVAALWAVVTLVVLVVALVTQLTLMIVAAALSGLVTALAAASAVGEPDPVPARTAPPARSANPRGNADRGRSPRQPGTATVTCTKTGTPIDECGCARRHVATSDGARRYRQPIGSPLGKQRTPKPAKPKRVKEPRVPTTSNAKPLRPQVGEVMRRVS